MATKEELAARVKRGGAKSGFATEYTGFFNIKPGHAKQLVDGVLSSLTSRGPDVRVSYAGIGVYDAKYVLFDNDTRLLLHIAFDNDFDTYFDDALMLLSGGSGDFGKMGASWMTNLEGSPMEGPEKATWEQVKNFFALHQIDASIYANTSNGSVKRVQKALDLQQAFQQVLDNPEAANALSHPALKPLLDLAAD
jgi:hypothetical protein